MKEVSNDGPEVILIKRQRRRTTSSEPSSCSFPLRTRSKTNVLMMMNASNRCKMASGYRPKGLKKSRPMAHNCNGISAMNMLLMTMDVMEKASSHEGFSTCSPQWGLRRL